ncbi:MAG: glutathione S-transferase family protein [Alphaproteobacteria bacterium]
MKLFFSRNPNPRLAVAVARHLRSPVAFAFAAPLAPGEAERFRPLNPNLRIPILEENGRGLWEADAIACRLARLAGSGFWPTGVDDEPELIRWLSWGKANFVHACDMVHFERGTRLRYGLGPVDEAKVAEGMAGFRAGAALLEAELAGRDWLLGDAPTYADFRMATFLPYNDVARLPLAEFPALQAWYGRLDAIDAWRDPFAGLDAPPLPPIPA